MAYRLDKLDLMHQHCADLQVRVEYAPLGPRRHGSYVPDYELIVLHPKLTRAQEMCAIAHELGHRLFGDRCSSPPGERRAWEYAAALLITPDEYRAAELQVGHHPSALAEELEVTAKAIDGWGRWWRKRGQYIDRCQLEFQYELDDHELVP